MLRLFDFVGDAYIASTRVLFSRSTFFMKKTLALLSVFLILFPSFSEAFFAYADAELSEVTIADGTGVSGVTSGIAENTTVESDQVNT